MILTKENIKPGLIIKNIHHEEWGNFRVIEKDESGNWGKRNSSGENVLREDELHFWVIVK